MRALERANFAPPLPRVLVRMAKASVAQQRLSMLLQPTTAGSSTRRHLALELAV